MPPAHPPVNNYQALEKEMISRFGRQLPYQWGEVIAGVRTRLDTHERVIALTLDACGSNGDGYDEKLINYLRHEKVPATLFINARWIKKNFEIFKNLSADPLFEIENHGWLHRPASVSGESAYGIKGTQNIKELIAEIELNALQIARLTGKKPQFYRSGTAFYDNVAIDVIYSLGYAPAGFDILGDKGATFSRQQVKDALLQSKPGSIIICHMNHPEKDTAEGLMSAIPQLKKRGFKFVKLSAYPLK